MVVVGSNGESSSATGINGNQGDTNAFASGAAYVFVRNGTNWGQQAYLKASDTTAWDLFGAALAASGDTVLVGAYGKGNFSGAAYVFHGLGIGPRQRLLQDGSGGYFIRLTGSPDCTYRLQRAASLGGPWSAIATNIAPNAGLIEYHDAAAPARGGFYRVVQP